MNLSKGLSQFSRSHNLEKVPCFLRVPVHCNLGQVQFLVPIIITATDFLQVHTQHHLHFIMHRDDPIINVVTNRHTRPPTAQPVSIQPHITSMAPPTTSKGYDIIE